MQGKSDEEALPASRQETRQLEQEQEDEDSQLVENLPTTWQETCQPHSTKPANYLAGNLPTITENTAEITQEITTGAEEPHNEEADALPVADEITSLDRASKYIKTQQPTLALDKVVDLATQKSKESREKRLQRPRKAIQNSNTMILYFSECFKEEFGCSAPLTLAKDRALMKKMIDNSGYTEVEDMIGWLFRNWKKFSKECKITGVPTIGMVFGFRGYLQGHTLIAEGVVSASEKAEGNPWGV